MLLHFSVFIGATFETLERIQTILATPSGTEERFGSVEARKFMS